MTVNMVWTRLVTVGFYVLFIQAQSLSNLNTTAISPCSVAYLETSIIQATGCQSSDLKCLCSSSAYVSAVLCCMAKSCSSEDEQAILDFEVSMCSLYNISVSSPVVCSPSAVNSPNSASNNQSAGLTTGAQIGIGFGAGFGLLIAVVAAIMLYRRFQARKLRQNSIWHERYHVKDDASPTTQYSTRTFGIGGIRELAGPGQIGSSMYFPPSWAISPPTTSPQPPTELPGSTFIHQHHPALRAAPRDIEVESPVSPLSFRAHPLSHRSVEELSIYYGE